MATANPNAPPEAADNKKKGDWSATQYLKFESQRTRPVRDLIAQIAPLIQTPNPTIYDLGCGPENSTTALLHQFPNAKVTGIDSSPDMLKKARTVLPSTTFELGDLSTYSPPSQDTDLLFSNAVFHWLRSTERITTITRLFKSLKRGAVIAFQVPDNYHEPSHRSMRETALLPSKPWSAYFADAKIGDPSDGSRPDLDPIQGVGQWFEALLPYAEGEGGGVQVWRTEYMHLLDDGVGGIVEWVKGTGLMPFLERIPEGEAGVRDAF